MLGSYVNVKLGQLKNLVWNIRQDNSIFLAAILIFNLNVVVGDFELNLIICAISCLRDKSR
jgi:hypothetical protein